MPGGPVGEVAQAHGRQRLPQPLLPLPHHLRHLPPATPSRRPVTTRRLRRDQRAVTSAGVCLRLTRVRLAALVRALSESRWAMSAASRGGPERARGLWRTGFRPPGRRTPRISSVKRPGAADTPLRRVMGPPASLRVRARLPLRAGPFLPSSPVAIA